MNATATAGPDAGLSHAQAMELQRTELNRVVEFLRSLRADEWSNPTDCPDWDVRKMFLHVLGACEGSASMKENVHQLRRARQLQKSVGGPLEAALSSVQVQERLNVEPGALVDRLAANTPTTIRKRTKYPSVLRRIRIPVDGPVVEKWSLGYLNDTIYLRDLWMHRIDGSRATGREPVLSADHDGIIVADIVREWARRHGKPYDLLLTGQARGHFVSTAPNSSVNGAADAIVIDAVEFCRTLAGRAAGTGLLATIVPF